MPLARIPGFNSAFPLCLILTLAGSGSWAIAMTRLTVQAPDMAGKGQAALLAWVETPVAGAAWRWEIEGGEIQGRADRDWVLFRAGHGKLVTLTCLAHVQGVLAGLGSRALPLQEPAHVPEAAFSILLPEMGVREGRLAVKVDHPDESRFLYQWLLADGTETAAGSEATLPLGDRDRVRVLCCATNRHSGARIMVQGEVPVGAPLEVPQVQLPDRIYEGRPVTARVTNTPSVGSCFYTWPSKELTDAGPELSVPGQGEFTFLPPRAGTRFVLTCQVRNTSTQEEKTWSSALVSLPVRPTLAPARIQDFRSDPSGPLDRDQRSVRLAWTLDRDPDRITVRWQGSGRERILAPSARACTLPGPFRGRHKITLETTRKDPETGDTACDSRTLELAVPGVSVLAGDVENLGAAYLREGTGATRPWGMVTGLAWKAPWLYIADGDQHTVRRIRAVGDAFTVEEVAGMRGLPGTGRAQEDRLFKPGQLVHRIYTPASGRPVREWLVLQPAANCIQAFQEDRVQESMRVLVGAFTPHASARARAVEARESKGEPAKGASALKHPVAMAVHPVTGQVFVADLGHRAIKRFGPEGDQEVVLAAEVEPGGIAVNRRGDVFYSDPRRHVVWVLRHDGSGTAGYARPEVFAGAEGQAGAADGDRIAKARFREPSALSVDTSDQEHLLISDTGNHLVRTIPADLTEAREVVTLGGNLDRIGSAMAFLPVHPTGVDTVLDPATGEIRLFAESTGNVHTIPGSADLKAGGAVLDRLGNLYFSDPGRHVVMVQRLLGGSPAEVPEYGAPEPFAGAPGQRGAREGIRLEPRKVPAATEPGETKEIPDPHALFDQPGALALDPKDDSFLLITDLGCRAVWRVPLDLSVIGKVKHTGKPSAAEAKAGHGGHVDGPRALSQFAHPRQLCGDGHGRVFVQDQTGPDRAGLIRRIDLDGKVSTLGGTGLDRSRRQYEEQGFHAPGGIGVDGVGNIFVADGRNRCIRRIGPDGKLAVVAGSQQAPDFTAADNRSAMTSCFDRLGFLGVDGLGRILVTEPDRPRLRLVDFSADAPGEGVVTLRDHLPSERVCHFPATTSAARNYLYVVAKPTGVDGEQSLMVVRHPATDGQMVDPKVRLQAICCDRANRIWAVQQPDPDQPEAIRINLYHFVTPKREAKRKEGQPTAAATQDPAQRLRMTDHWEKRVLTLMPAADGEPGRIDGRPYAPCGIPRIAAIATDSHNHLYLADAGNGMIWKVEGDLPEGADPHTEAKEQPATLRRVAGGYPYLGPVGEGLDSPLPPMQGLAVTPDDDLVLTCGNAVLGITLPRSRPPSPWRAAAGEPWAPAERKERKEGKETKTAPIIMALKNADLDKAWRLSMNRAQARLDRALASLHHAKLKQRTVAKEYEKEPFSQRHKATLENLVPIIAAGERELAFAQAEAAAKTASYNYLLALEASSGALTLQEQAGRLEGLRADSIAKQARFEHLGLTSHREAKDPGAPPTEVDRLRLAHLEAIQAANQATVDLQERVRAWQAMDPSAPGFASAEAAITRAADDRTGRESELAKAQAAIEAFNGRHGAALIEPFQPWTAPVKDKKDGTEKFVAPPP